MAKLKQLHDECQHWVGTVEELQMRFIQMQDIGFKHPVRVQTPRPIFQGFRGGQFPGLSSWRDKEWELAGTQVRKHLLLSGQAGCGASTFVVTLIEALGVTCTQSPEIRGQVTGLMEGSVYAAIPSIQNPEPGLVHFQGLPQVAKFLEAQEPFPRPGVRGILTIPFGRPLALVEHILLAAIRVGIMVVARTQSYDENLLGTPTSYLFGTYVFFKQGRSSSAKQALHLAAIVDSEFVEKSLAPRASGVDWLKSLNIGDFVFVSEDGSGFARVDPRSQR